MKVHVPGSRARCLIAGDYPLYSRIIKFQIFSPCGVIVAVLNYIHGLKAWAHLCASERKAQARVAGVISKQMLSANGRRGHRIARRKSTGTIKEKTAQLDPPRVPRDVQQKLLT
jgi:hypothetical protein